MAAASDGTHPTAPRPTSADVRAGTQRIREIGRAAAAHAGNAAVLLRLAASERERAARRR